MLKLKAQFLQQKTVQKGQGTLWTTVCLIFILIMNWSANYFFNFEFLITWFFRRSHSAPGTVRNVNLQQIPEQHSNITCHNPTYAQPYQHISQHQGRLRFVSRDQTYTSLHPSSTPDHMISEPRSHPPAGPTKSDTFSNTSTSSGSVSGDSAYSSKPCLYAIKSAHRPVIYGPIPFASASGQFAAPLPIARRSSLEQKRRCPCHSCGSDRLL